MLSPPLTVTGPSKMGNKVMFPPSPAPGAPVPLQPPTEPRPRPALHAQHIPPAVCQPLEPALPALHPVLSPPPVPVHPAPSLAPHFSPLALHAFAPLPPASSWILLLSLPLLR